MSTPLLAHLMICTGPACSERIGSDGADKPPIDVRGENGLVARWKQHRLYRHIHLTLTGCLGQCGRANQAALLTGTQTIYLERLDHQADVDRLLHWALDCAAADRLLPLTRALQRRRYERLAIC